MLSFQIGDCRAVAHQCYVTYLYSQPNSWSQIKALLLGLAKKCTLLQSFCKFRLPQYQPSALSISPPAGIKIISAHTFFGFKRTYYTEMVLFELLDETGSKLWFRNTYEKVKSDLWNWNKANTKKVPFFRDTLYYKTAFPPNIQDLILCHQYLHQNGPGEWFWLMNGSRKQSNNKDLDKNIVFHFWT